MIQHSGLIMWISFLHFKILQNFRRSPWLLTTWKGKPTSGGNRFANWLKKKDAFYHGQILKTNSGLILVLQSVDFDEALSRIRQGGSLRDYQREFEWLGNRVHGWMQKAFVGTFIGGLKIEISDGIRMFKPQTLKEAISLARIKDDQLSRQRRFIRPAPPLPIRSTLSPPSFNRAAPTVPANPIWRLTWEEM